MSRLAARADASYRGIGAGQSRVTKPPMKLSELTFFIRFMQDGQDEPVWEGARKGVGYTSPGATLTGNYHYHVDLELLDVWNDMEWSEMTEALTQEPDNLEVDDFLNTFQFTLVVRRDCDGRVAVMGTSRFLHCNGSQGDNIQPVAFTPMCHNTVYLGQLDSEDIPDIALEQSDSPRATCFYPQLWMYHDWNDTHQAHLEKISINCEFNFHLEFGEVEFMQAIALLPWE